MEFVHELYSRKEAYERELLMAEAKIAVITDIIADVEAKNAVCPQPNPVVEETATDAELADFAVPTTITDESY
jgi:hypothetical protein